MKQIRLITLVMTSLEPLLLVAAFASVDGGRIGPSRVSRRGFVQVTLLR